VLKLIQQVAHNKNWNNENQQIFGYDKGLGWICTHIAYHYGGEGR